MVVLALAAAFFAWVTAEPALVTIGHASSGTATVSTCAGGGIQRRCQASFEDASGRLLAVRVPLLWAGPADATPGAVVSARMVSGGRAAYADHRGLRVVWLAGLLTLLLCGFALAWAGGATRLPTRRTRALATLASLAAPLVLFLGMLAASW